MLIQVIAVGKLKEPFYQAAQEEYCKRLKVYTNLFVEEVAEEKLPPDSGVQVLQKVRQREGERLLKRLKPHAKCIALDPCGKMFSSEEFAGWLGEQISIGVNLLSFLIGGTVGLPTCVLEKADLVWSLSRLTFPHQLARVILLEQLYRAFKILRNEPYHY
jgi:23S rRNA (pseudouridine1915-N3)-methyltransferase